MENCSKSSCNSGVEERCLQLPLEFCGLWPFTFIWWYYPNTDHADYSYRIWPMYNFPFSREKYFQVFPFSKMYSDSTWFWVSFSYLCSDSVSNTSLLLVFLFFSLLRYCPFVLFSHNLLKCEGESDNFLVFWFNLPCDVAIVVYALCWLSWIPLISGYCFGTVIVWSIF